MTKALLYTYPYLQYLEKRSHADIFGLYDFSSFFYCLTKLKLFMMSNQKLFACKQHQKSFEQAAEKVEKYEKG